MTIIQEVGQPYQPKVLFICKRRNFTDPDTGYSQGGLSSGLLNSATFVAKMLCENEITAKVVQVQDNNGIDREVSRFQPDVAIIEAVWVVPEKFDELCRRHPSVKWVIRLHSNSSFAANEGIFYDWVMRYFDYGHNIYINTNAHEMFTSLDLLLSNKYEIALDNFGRTVNVDRRLSQLPNYYPVSCKEIKHNHDKPHIDIGLFGACRPLKNQVLQSVAAIRFAEELGKPLQLHINVGRVENNGGPVLKNLRNLFASQNRHKLVEHEWMSHGQFIRLAKQMELGLQVSFTETFCIVAADLVNTGVPVVVSKEVSFVDEQFHAETTDVGSIVEKMWAAYRTCERDLKRLNKDRLEQYSEKSKQMWLSWVERMID